MGGLRKMGASADLIAALSLSCLAPSANLPRLHPGREIMAQATATTRPKRLASCGALCLCIAWLGAAGCTSMSQHGRVPQNVVAGRQLLQHGMEAEHRGQWPEAESFYQRAVEASPADERARRHYAETLWHRGVADEAVAQMDEAVRLSGGDPQLRILLGQMCASGDDLHRAEQCARQAIRAQPKLPAAWALLGDCQRRRGELDEALASYHRAISHQESFPRVQLEIAEIYRRQNRPQRALATLDSLADQYPPSKEPPRVLYLRGLALSALERYDAAAEELSAAIERGQATADAYYQLGNVELQAGRPTSARWAVRRALDLAPDHGPSRGLLGRIEAEQQRMAAHTADEGKR